MRRLWGLLSKEVSHHGWVLALVGVFSAAMQTVLLLGVSLAPRNITIIEAHAIFVRLFLPMLAVALGHRLIVREYYARTQRFLEALPIHRVEVLVTKYCLGASLLGLAVTASLGFTAAIALAKEPVTALWLGIVLIRSQVFMLTLWSVLFAMGFFGRWRIPVYLAIALGLLFLNTGTDFQLARFGPFFLAGPMLALERLVWPWTEMSISMLIALCAVVVAALLALLNEGSLAESLAKRMTRRELVGVGVVLALAMIAWEVAEPKTEAEPLEFESASVVRRGDVALSVLYLQPAHRAAADGLADALASDLATLHDRLPRVGEIVPVHVALYTGRGPHEYRAPDLEGESEGVLVRANFVHPSFDRERLCAFVLGRVIERETDRRAALEPHSWVRSGTAALIAYRGVEPDLSAASYYRRHRRPAYGSLERLRRTRERFGEGVTHALVASAALSFVERSGESAWFEFARDVLREPDIGIFEVLRERRRPVRERFERAAGSIPTFEAAWGASLASRLLEDDPGLPPRAEAFSAIEPDEGQLRNIRWGVRFASAPSPGLRCALVHAPLGPYDLPLGPDEAAREEIACAAMPADGEWLMAAYSSGDRVMLAVEIGRSGAWFRLSASRQDLR